ncbi:Scr1 family TA system antitoxin-like transcriptional regulator, partial [Saccharothrix longispora]
PPTRPLAYGDNGTAVVFHDHPAEVEHHQRRMRELHARALPEAQSREVIAHWADAYDKRNR